MGEREGRRSVTAVRPPSPDSEPAVTFEFKLAHRQQRRRCAACIRSPQRRARALAHGVGRPRVEPLCGPWGSLRDPQGGGALAGLGKGPYKNAQARARRASAWPASSDSVRSGARAALPSAEPLSYLRTATADPPRRGNHRAAFDA
jgi:hypothetical protein